MDERVVRGKSEERERWMDGWMIVKGRQRAESESETEE
jgi:hypothetical protein